METQRRPARPIFVVGSPRSGTSILTWCLGQHPNVLALEEGNWLDKFAYELGSTFERGSRRGDRSQLSALGIGPDEFYAWFGLAIDDLITTTRSRYFERARSIAAVDPTQIHPSIQLSREPDEPKLRWVDGTPEYSFCIYALLRLFPEARFIHIVRDVTSVVKSLVRFSPAGRSLVLSERAAYEYWLRATRACTQAERAFGSARIRRIRYNDMVEDPVLTFRDLCAFLGEAFCPRCLEPLERKINSSHVPADFDCRDGTTPASLAEKARELSEQLQSRQLPLPADPGEAAELEHDFRERVEYFGNLDAEFEKTIAHCRALETELADRTEWAQKLDTIIAERDRTIRQFQRELEKQTVGHIIWRVAMHLKHRGRPTC